MAILINIFRISNNNNRLELAIKNYQKMFQVLNNKDLLQIHLELDQQVKTMPNLKRAPRNHPKL